MSVTPTRFHTRPLISGTLQIDVVDNVMNFSLLVESGTCTLQGNFPFKGVDSSPIILTSGQGYTLPAYPQSPLDGVIITAVGGTTNVTLTF